MEGNSQGRDQGQKALDQGQDLLDRGQFQEALEYFQMLATEDPQNPQILLRMGRAYRGLERRQEGIDCFSQALKIQPQWLLALAARGKFIKS